MLSAVPFFSVIVPVRNGGALFRDCLQALHDSSFDDWELIVVDDGSADESALIAKGFGASLYESPGRGPAYARNLGAHQASGTFLFFLDADCQVHSNTLAQTAVILNADSTIDGLFGSYDDAPAASNLISQYKNLQHHYVHQTSSREAHTFWTGCGCVKRDVFFASGGFDAERYARPAIEDIELGYRLTEAGYRIVLVKEVQVKHLKRWTLTSWLKADIFSRAVPWTELLLERPRMSADLNLQWEQRASGVLALLMVLLLGWRRGRLYIIAPILCLLWLNRSFYTFLNKKRGFGFAIATLPLHWCYYLYSSITFGCVTLLHHWRERR